MMNILTGLLQRQAFWLSSRTIVNQLNMERYTLRMYIEGTNTDQWFGYVDRCTVQPRGRGFVGVMRDVFFLAGLPLDRLAA